MIQPEERNLGEQPIAKLMQEHGLKPHDLVAASDTRITHKMVSRACKGRWLTPHTRALVANAMSRAAGIEFAESDLFNY